MEKNKSILKIEWTATVWTKWQIVIPKQARAKFNLQTWSNLIILSSDFWLVLIESENLNNMMNKFEKIIDTTKNI